MANTIQIKRRVTGAAGAPTTLKSAELSYNMQDKTLYIGKGDDGSGNATSVVAFAKDDFIVNIPGGGTTGQVLAKASNTAGDVSWQTVTSGTTYTASGDGIELTGSNFALNYSEIDTGLTLTSRLADKAPLASPTFTGTVTTAASAVGGAGLNLPHGAAPTTPSNGDFWSTTAGLFSRVNGATKTIAFTDSNITGSAATLTTPRNINGTAFDGSANITITANTPNNLTFNNAGSGAASGTTFNGGTAQTISYNSIGAAPLNAPTFTGKVTTAATAAGGAGFNLPQGTAPSAPANGDLWTTSGGLFVQIASATKTVAFTDSNITGSAASLTNSRNFSISGGGITASNVSFNGTGNVTLSASVDNDHITNARLANMATMTIKGNNTGSTADPLDLTTAQVKTMLAIVPGDIGAGTFATSQIPSLDAGKITSGTFGNAFISDLDASKLTGTIDIARLPVLPGTVQEVSSGGIANLTAGQQSNIGDGSIVTTTDGRRWVYTGSGSKTAEASYIEMADVTPEWSIVANRPANVVSLGGLTGTSGAGIYFSAANTLSEYTTTTFGRGLVGLADASALRSAAGLGTMATQNASAVAITGGTIDGVVLDGGTF